MIYNIDTTAQIARNHGFVFTEKCNCGGSLQYKYEFEKWKLKIFPNKKKFQLSNGTIQFMVLLDWEKIDETLNQHFKIPTT